MTDVITGIPNVLLVGAIALGAYSIYDGMIDTDDIDEPYEVDDEEEE